MDENFDSNVSHTLLASKPVTTRLQRSSVVKRDTLGGVLFGLRLAVSFFRDSEMW